MKAKADLVISFTRQSVLDQPETFLLIESNGTTMRDGLRQSSVTIVFGDYDIAVCASFPAQDAWMRFIANHKRRLIVGSVLLDTIDLDC